MSKEKDIEAVLIYQLSFIYGQILNKALKLLDNCKIISYNIK